MSKCITHMEWSGVRLEKSLVDAIDRFISSQKSTNHGVRRYHSRTDFVREACLRMLDQEEGEGDD
jgi:Arc/MetJ-type ribon-helix-helix transcriptional regulator